MPVKERALLFGESKSLVGVVSDGGDRSRAAPGFVLLNAGILHRVGPNRLHVRLARTLAETGFTAMRFDFAGLGDSRPNLEAMPFVQRALQDTRQAMDALRSLRGCERFVLLGICSGADAALRAALRDDRVAGAVLIEPYTVRRPGFLLYSYRRRLLSPRAWLRLVGGRSELWSTLRGARLRRDPAAEAPASSAPADPSPEPARVDQLLPSLAELRAQIRTVLERGVELCFVYSVDSPAYFNYRTLLRRELRPAFRSGRARLEALRDTDHVFTPLAAQERLVEVVADWARGRLAPGR